MIDDGTLDELRREIDAIDDRIHEQLVRRTEIVGRVADAKKRRGGGALALRPGREAAILRRLAARHSGDFPLPALLRIWRELLAGQVAIQGGLSLGVAAPDGANVFHDLAREHFGAAARMKEYEDTGQLLQDVWRGGVSVGVVPVPDGEPADAWWRGLVAGGRDAPRIVAEIPFWRGGADGSERPAAWALAKLAPEATGDDVTVVAIERRGAVSRGRLRGDLRACGLRVETLAVWRHPGRAERASYVVAAEGFLAADAPPLAKLAEALADDDLGQAAVLGSFARPIRIDGP